MEFDEISSKFVNVKALVVGDAMLDIDIHTKYHCPSYEIGGPILKGHKVINYPGGAANVAMNLKSLGAMVKLLCPLGSDSSGEWLKQKLAEDRIEWLGKWSTSRNCWNHTTTKTRIYRDGGEPVCRVDNDVRALLPYEDIIKTMELEKFDIMLLSDYQKGAFVVDPQVLITRFRAANPGALICANAKPIIVNQLEGIDLLCLNESEFRQSFQPEVPIWDRLIHLNIARLIRTKGAQGLDVYAKDGSVRKIPGNHYDKIDPVGAGDAVFAAASLTLTQTDRLDILGDIANAAGSAKVQLKGTKPVSIGDVRAVLYKTRVPYRERTD